ncbi:chloride channel [Calycina marina]|uniref:Chloride channel n=1 Tax=Calycina marina TaxID=1763456 RepID=A0A9P7Z0I6_9HELO|nr:chloride channel [Calycina marina]
MAETQPESAEGSSPRSPGHTRNDSPDDERRPLLSTRSSSIWQRRGQYTTGVDLASHPPSRHASFKTLRNHNRGASWGARLATALQPDRYSFGVGSQMRESKGSLDSNERVWYDQFTSTDWVHDSIADAFRLKELRNRKDIQGRILAFLDGGQGWVLSALVGLLVAVIAYVVDVSEEPVFDWKDGYCNRGWLISEKYCCPDARGGSCDDWESWSKLIHIPGVSEDFVEFGFFVLLVVVLATLSCLLTLTTKTIVPSTYRITTLDENLGAPARHHGADETTNPPPEDSDVAQPMVYYSAAGSGVAEVRVILSGFVLHGFLGVKTLVIKTAALILSVASGLSLGKEGPFVHIATCVGNIACRIFAKYDHNDAKRREVLSAAAAAGVAVAFGAPLGGVLFSLEEVSYFFPAKTLFRTFLCCICAALTLKFLNPYGNNKVVIFEVRYVTDWEFFELGSFIVVGMMGGALGALFIKASRKWAQSFRKIPVIKKWPLLEVFLVALLTGLVSYWNPFTKTPVAKLLFNLASPCSVEKNDPLGLCPQNIDEVMPVVRSLAAAFVIKGLLTIVTFGIKVPAGIYVPSMVVGGLGGRVIGHLIQWLVLRFPATPIFGSCAAYVTGESCITPGVYALIAAGSTMCGVTRLSVTLAVILFELTGSLDYVLPFSLAILVSKWTADFIEPLSIYDLLTNMNSYPFLNNKHKPIFTSELSDIMHRVRRERIIDISDSPLVSAVSLRKKLNILHQAGENDGGLPIIRRGILVGLIPAPDLDFALDNLPDEAHSRCLMAEVNNMDSDEDDGIDPTDFTPYIDPAPLALDIQSHMDLVYECYAKLGLRYLCISREGKFAGLVRALTPSEASRCSQLLYRFIRRPSSNT